MRTTARAARASTATMVLMLARSLTIMSVVTTATALGQAQSVRPRGHLTPFASDSDLAAFVRKLASPVSVGSSGPPCSGSGATMQTFGVRQPASGAVVRGVITDVAGKPIVQGRVVVGRLAIAASTGDSGEFHFEIPAAKLPKADTFALRVLAIGHTPVSRLVALSPGDSLRFDAKLCQSVVQLESVVLTAATASEADAITNVQHAGVDEGDIVKLAGDYLIILRRGRLFTVAVNGDALRPVSMSDAFGPGIDPRGTWYDEMLIDRDRVVVVGYSYSRGGTEVGVFDLDRWGNLHHRGTYQLRSNDYYSARNYASRLIDGRLIFYTPLYVAPWGADPLAALPALRKWRPDTNGNGRFERITSARHVYQPAVPLTSSDVALHTVTVCDLRRADVSCQASAVLGPSARVFYVSPRAVYVWASPWRSRADSVPSMVYRMPLDGSAPTALRTAGTPIDQFSFLESDDGYLNVLVRSDAGGDAMWRTEHTTGSAALARLSLDEFGDGTASAPRSDYRALPIPEGEIAQNRFVGDYVLYGAGNGWRSPTSRTSTLFAGRWRDGSVAAVALPHPIDRIEPMGRDAVVIGADKNTLHFSGVSLGGTVALNKEWTLPDAAQGELRSHGFFYHPDGEESGVLGLPIRGGGDPGYSHLLKESAGVLYLRNSPERFTSLGTLSSRPGISKEDGCLASCVDWYGNARPLFIRDRVFALLGYELVEGRLSADWIAERRRVEILPRR